MTLSFACAAPASAQDACSFFADKTVELIVPFNAGGGYDVYGRLVAKHMGKELGANAMIVVNRPGAGGLLATNQTFHAPPDGLLVQLVPISGIVAAELGGAEGVLFKSREFSWIGRVSSEPDAVVVAPESEITSLEDVQKIGATRKVRIGSTGLGSPQYISIKLLADFIQTDSDVVTGFSTAAEIFPSLVRGEVDLFVSSLSAAETAEKAEAARILWTFGSQGLPDRPEVKPLSEVIDAAFHPINEVHDNAITAGRAIAAPPGMPAERLECMREAFDRAMASEGLLSEAAALNRPVNPLSGDELTTLVGKATEGLPQEYLDILTTSFAR
ncbi:MAG: tripartite tricarboxylate transporter substrate-binding protein [Pseudomonadota bacterium]|nr:tripartite tricarboxylate transporter substrate-binding protein [Pseudomonadota bacterium]MDQ2703984.1 tripartite tricarboxylate transporter substrate-binding protein [Pseudomonadota bacterium]